MKRYVSAASRTKNFTSNEEWCEWITKKLHLNEDDSDMLLHDLNNLRADEWLETLEDADIPENDIEQFAEFFELNDNEDEDIYDFLIDFAYETCDLEEPYTESEYADFKQRCKELGYVVTEEDFKVYLDKVADILD